MTDPTTKLPDRLRELHSARARHFTSPDGVQAWSIVATEERLADLREAANVCEALDEFLQKTEWVQDEYSAGQLPLALAGMHRADIMTAEIQRLRAELALVPTVQPIHPATALADLGAPPELVEAARLMCDEMVDVVTLAQVREAALAIIQQDAGNSYHVNAVEELCKRLGVEL